MCVVVSGRTQCCCYVILRFVDSANSSQRSIHRLYPVCSRYLMLQYCYRDACAIDMGETVIITGGEHTKRKVTQYNEDGQHKELPELITGRRYHGCSSYVDSDNNIVSNSFTQ